MRVITDLHLHSKWSRACSKQLTLRNIAATCERKGIQLVGTADMTHPAWRDEIIRELEPCDEQVFRLRESDSPTRFLLTTELSCIYKRDGRVRRVHHLVVLPTLVALDRLIHTFEQRGCNLKSDGRPILGIDSEELLKIVLDADPRALFIPAHAWTPWFAVFGSQSGFDALEDCFGDLTKHVFAIETGLSSSPSMNWRLSKLDRVFLVSNSDAHSLDKLGREANVFEMQTPSYNELYDLLRTHDTKRFLETIEFFPEEGKYHADGHRACGFFCNPRETKRLRGTCPRCGRPLTIGVLHRIDALADREEPLIRPVSAVPYRSIIPLAEIVSEILGTAPASKRVQHVMNQLVTDGRTEFGILLDIPLSELTSVASPEMIEALRRMRAGQVHVQPGYDGKFGVVHVFDAQSQERKPTQSQFSIVT